jgi:hypothetical protein
MVYKIGNYYLLGNLATTRDFTHSFQSLKYSNTVVELTNVYNKKDETNPEYIMVENHGGWIIATAVVREATEEEVIESRKQREIKKKERDALRKKCVCDIESIEKIANSIFGKENVDANVKDKHILIYFPEINITNNKNNKHTIKDLYIRVNISPNSDDDDGESNESDALLYISINGARTTISIEEYFSYYIHSHLPGQRHVDFAGFCTGSSDFAMLMEDMRYTPTKENWEMFFLSLERYLAWESLEGGPFIKMSRIRAPSGRKTRASINYINRFINNYLRGFPKDAFELYDNGLLLISGHSSFIDYINRYCSIKVMGNVSQRQIDNIVGSGMSGTLVFKGKHIPGRITCDKKYDDDTVVSQKVINEIEERINNKLRLFNNKLIYEQRRKEREGIPFKRVGAFKQANSSDNKKTESADRLPAPQVW